MLKLLGEKKQKCISKMGLQRPLGIGIKMLGLKFGDLKCQKRPHCQVFQCPHLASQ